MAVKVIGYQIYLSSGGNTCVQCRTRMRKGLPYLSPVKGRKKREEIRGKSLCLECIREMMENVEDKLQSVPKAERERYATRRFLEHLDKGDDNGTVQ